MRAIDDPKTEPCGSVAANRYLRRAVDKCLGEGIEREQVAEALVRMAEAVQSEIAEERAEYRLAGPGSPEGPESFDLDEISDIIDATDEDA